MSTRSMVAVLALLGALSSVPAACGPTSSVDGAGPADRDAGAFDEGGPTEGASVIDAPTDSPGREAPATVARYEYSFDLRTAAADVRLTIGAPAAAGCASLANRLPLSQVVAEDAPGVTVGQRDGLVSLCGDLPASFTLSAQTTVPEDADPMTDVGFSRVADASGATFSYLLGWVESCNLFGPCNPAPAELSQFLFDIRHDPEDVVLCPGIRESAEGRTRCRLESTLAPTYSAFAVAADRAWQRWPITEAAGVSVVIYEAAAGQVRTTLDAAAVGAFLEWITTLLGPFPFGPELRLATAPVRWAGMEHPANIVVRQDLPALRGGYADLTMHTVLHEIAHQWAGDRTTIASALDFAWKEAIAEYLAYVFEEERISPAEAAATRSVWRTTGLGAFYPVRPLSTPAAPLSVWIAGVYGSGPMALFLQLEPWLGRSLLLETLRRHLTDPGARGVADLKTALEASSGRDLDRYFDAWVFGTVQPEWPALAVQTTAMGDQTLVTVRQSQSAGVIFPCAVDVELSGATHSARATIDFGVAPGAPEASALLAFGEPVTGARIDPDGRLLAWSTLLSLSPIDVPTIPWHP